MSEAPKISPPRWADRFLRLYCRDEFLEEIQGDVYELFEVRQQESLARARRLFVWDVFRFFRWSNIKKINRSYSNSNVMIKNYIKIGWRGLVKDKLYSTINLSGLAVAITVFLLIFLFVKEETSYDKYHEDGDRIYRVVSNLTTPGNYFEFALTPPHLGARMQEDFPSVSDRLRLAQVKATVLHEGETYEQVPTLLADAEFLQFFSIPLVDGNATTMLAEPYSVVLTESAAVRFFGSVSPVGKLLELDGYKQPFQVTGVLKDIPRNTHFSTDMILSMETRVSEEYIRPGQWFFLDYYTYLKFTEETGPGDIQAGMTDFIEQHIGEAQRSANQTYEFEFQKLNDIHLKSDRDVEIAENGNQQYVILFSIVALFILVIACLNFINLSTARAAVRAKEVGVRKAVGAIRRQLVSQFLVESWLISGLAFAIGFLLTYLLLPAFNTLVGQQLLFELLFAGSMPLIWLTLWFGLGFLAGVYPAVFLSRFKPVSVLKSSRAQGGSNLLRKGLVIFQLCISTVLVMGVLVINKQLTWLQTKHLGFDKDQIVLVDYASGPDKAEILRTAFENVPGVQGVSLSTFSPKEGAFNWFTQYETDPGVLTNASMYGALVDFEFMETYGLELLAGRTFDKSITTDLDSAYILNEAAIKKIGYESNEAALGKLIGQNGNMGRIIGVMKDINFESLHHEIEPMLLYIANPNFYRFVSIKLEGERSYESLSKLEAAWNEVIPDKPFEAGFLNDRLDQNYRAEMLTRKIFLLFSNLAIFIAVLGLFALSTFSVAQQQKAISVRKVLGASVSSLIGAMALKFSKLSLLALLVAVPIAWLLADSWLDNFSYHINFGVAIPIIAAVFVIGLTIITVSLQSLKISRTNPARTLRSE